MSEGEVGESEDFEAEEEREDEGDEEKEEEEEEEDKQQGDQLEEEVVKSKVLSEDVAGEGLSLLCKIGSGLAHAYVRMDLKEKALTDVSILKNYMHVRYVDLSGNALEDISCLGELPHLLTLKADHNRLTSARLPELQYLQIASFAHNHITSTEGISHPMLASLNLSANRISEVSGLNSNNLPCLQILDLHANQLQTISCINLPTLQKLYLASNKLTQCDGIQCLHQLTTLHLRENSIATLDGFVPSLKALQYINFRGNFIENLSELNKLKCLPLLRALVFTDNPLCEMDDYRVEVCLVLRQLERLDKEQLTEDERADAEELYQQRQDNEEK